MKPYAGPNFSFWARGGAFLCSTNLSPFVGPNVPQERKDLIFQDLFENLPIKQTKFYLEPTMCVTKHFIDLPSTVILLKIRDRPGNITVDTLGASLNDFLIIFFIIDTRDLYQRPVVEFIVAACQVNPDVNFEVFVHKAERPAGKLSSDTRGIMDRFLGESPEFDQITLDFHLTSIYNHLLREASSCVLHKLIVSLPYLEELLNIFRPVCLFTAIGLYRLQNAASPRTFLFDTLKSTLQQTPHQQTK
ncbi:Gtr1/RagA G protein conserved region-domain-containing protein [Suillus subaureus]|uniref:GTP-binding protein n=1 Tax=Suillus subaureus TaxID=48587 RepID=A0A9P7J5V6_9AGAM|nr:Gtr1/RagA G protein conserved region-domain-containing protein [Suillus subaureus]XP_041188671.1 Gtr1/RagA G protein conserved region-domain-containing protein [Suillus subaureus]KAG1804389.1 Gtr1/RagA G protein conserved region-domain-containing protein [Suillus subaureus]KAG1808456.1 Gtr1/RagA G protein conserved region-domain-containing protein [Suillus subaureus]